MYLIKNGQLVFENKIAQNHDMLIADGKICKIAPAGVIKVDGADVIDARGGYVAPGFIDIHSDYIEHMAAPRPTTVLDFQMAAREIEKQLINQGVTTMYHSLSLMKDSYFTPQKIRTPENVKKLIDMIEKIDGQSKLIHHKFHARFEIDNVDQVQLLCDFIMQNKIHLLSFMDHTPGQGQYRNLENYCDIMKGYKDMNNTELEQHIQEYQDKEKLDWDTISTIAALAQKHHIAVASHDDDSVEKLDVVKSFGTTISEFPITMEVAKAAQAKNMYTTAGAPNVLLGGSHAGNLSAAEAIGQGCIDILCSDYFPASLLHAVFHLHNHYGLNLAELFQLVTINPAKAVGISREYGSLAEGKQGDVIIIDNAEDEFPVITAVFVDGRLVSTLNYYR
ncbi:MAG: phosphonate metabolism protein PhnM [Clostridiales bacterium]|jgi:alpha-D-ribose 1-methylphosphonate 5-triphosphate diphosphatase|nr:phosphonate metabolism protein PhnM [Clostridiales bacterium]